MANAIDVSRYILEQRSARGHITTTYALQKLLYYCQSWHLVAFDTPLFDEKIEAWKNGPVVPAIWPYCRQRWHVIPSEIPTGDSRNLDTNESLLIDRVLATVEDYEDQQLGDYLKNLSHEEDPWRNAYESDSDKDITQDAMLEYFSNMRATSSHEIEPYITDLSSHTNISNEDYEFIASILETS